MNEKYHFTNNNNRNDKIEIVGKSQDHSENIFKKYCIINKINYSSYTRNYVQSHVSQLVGIYSIYKYNTLIATVDAIWLTDESNRIINHIDELTKHY